MASSFVQLLSSIQATEDANKSAASAALDAANGGSHGNNSNGTSSNSSSSSSNNNSGGAAGRAGVGATGRSIAAVAAAAAAAAAAKAAEPQATMNLMGSVTKKLVLTPSHDIGVRRPRGYSTAAASAAQKKNLPSELMHALGQQQYPEDEEVVGDV